MQKDAHSKQIGAESSRDESLDRDERPSRAPLTSCSACLCLQLRSIARADNLGRL